MTQRETKHHNMTQEQNTRENKKVWEINIDGMTHTRTGAWAQERHTHTHRRGHRGQRHMGSLNVQKLTWKQLRITNVNLNTRGHKNTRNTKCCVKMIQNDDKITTKRRFLYSFIQRLAELLAALLFMY